MEARIVDLILLAGRAGSIVLLLLVGWKLARPADPLSWGVGFSLACAVTLVMFPIARQHYFVLLAPAVLLLPCWMLSRGHETAARWLAIAPAAMTVAHYLAIDIIGRIGLLGISTAIWFAAACLAVLISDAEPAVTAASSRPEVSRAARRAAA